MESPSYYAVIPANVRYAAISPMAKLLYGEISCLTKQEGFCWCSNGYLAKLYDAGTRSVARWIAELEASGFIKVEPALNQHGKRRIFLADAAPILAGQKWQAKNGAQKETREENNTSSEKTPIPPSCFEEFWEAWPVHERKRDRRRCEEHWQRHKLDAIATVILSALIDWRSGAEWKRDRGKYIPAPLVWLRNERWECPPPAATSAPLDMSEVPF